MSTNIQNKGPASNTKKGGKCGCALDTLAQLGTNDENSTFPDVQSLTSVDDTQALKKRARRKYLTNGYVGALVDATKENEDSTLRKAYWNTYHCARTLTLKSDRKISGKYCKNRWCLVCNSIRTAELIKRYNPILADWQDKYFVTLTIPNIEAQDLPEAVELMQKTFSKLQGRIKKQAQRGQTDKFKGLRKLEVTYNPGRNDFHPHFHVIVKGEANAKNLLSYWLQAYNSTFQSAIWGEATTPAQDVRKADDKSVLELFKYFTKLISVNKGNRMIYADAMDVMFNAVKGKRVFQNFGFRAPKAELSEEEQAEATAAAKEEFALAEYEWNQQAADWQGEGLVVDRETGEVLEEQSSLSGHTPSEQLRELVETKVVTRKNHSWQRWAGRGAVIQHRNKQLQADEEKQERTYIAQGMEVMAKHHTTEKAKQRARSVLQYTLLESGRV
jgi:plasmid rolling circle replication initiator protein Rep